MRNERYFSNPGGFDPSRFLGALEGNDDNSSVHPLNIYSAANPSSMVFGFGRRFVIVMNNHVGPDYLIMLFIFLTHRICPGRFFADASAYLVMANVLAAFNILPPIDPETGKEYIPELELVGGTTALVILMN